jgi:hypothetical protein
MWVRDYNEYAKSIHNALFDSLTKTPAGTLKALG